LSARIDAELDRLGAAALVVLGAEGDDPDLSWFARGARLGDAFVVVPRGVAPRLGYFTPMERDEARATGLDLLTPEQLGVVRLVRESHGPAEFLASVLEAALAACGVEPGRLAVSGRWPAGVLLDAGSRLAESGWRLVSATSALRRLRKRKDAQEIEELRRVAAATGEVFRELAVRLAAAVDREGELWSEGERLTVGRLKAEAAVGFARRGLTQPRQGIVAPAEEGGVPHTTGTPERVLRAGESLVVDLFPKGELFADLTRTFCVGRPSETLVRAHADVLAALEAARAAARPGARGWDLQVATCELLGARGWPTPISEPGTERGYVHGLGHGVGHELHEEPSFKKEAGDEGMLEAGDVVTLEPGLYDPTPGGFGVRLEDQVVLRDHGIEDLVSLPYDLDPGAWRGA